MFGICTNLCSFNLKLIITLFLRHALIEMRPTKSTFDTMSHMMSDGRNVQFCAESDALFVFHRQEVYILTKKNVGLIYLLLTKDNAEDPR